MRDYRELLNLPVCTDLAGSATLRSIQSEQHPTVCNYNEEACACDESIKFPSVRNTYSPAVRARIHLSG